MAQNPRVSGRQQFAYYSVDAGVTWNRFGRETGGGPTIDPALRHRMELGGVDTMVGGLISGEFTLEFDIGHGGIFPTGAAGITPNYVLREWSVAAGLYPDTTLEVDGNGDGVLWVGIGLGLDVAGAPIIVVYKKVKVAEATISCREDEALHASVRFLACEADWTELVAKPTPVAVTNYQVYEWQHGVVSVEGDVDHRVRGFAIHINNNLTAEADMAAATAGSQRFYNELVEGDEAITLDVTTRRLIPLATIGDPFADELASASAFNAAFTNAAGTPKVFTVALADMGRSAMPGNLDNSGNPIDHDYSYECPVNGDSITLTYA